jgi:hypothetical protein
MCVPRRDYRDWPTRRELIRLATEAYMRMLRRGLPEQDQRKALEQIGTQLRLLQTGATNA